MDIAWIATKNDQGVILVTEKISRVCILSEKNRQGSFLAAEKQAGHILGSRKTGKELHPPENA